jgi:SpoIID/LytB domain protein
VERGTSGRLIKLRIVGTKKTLVIGKELEIRRTLSRSHLYSSAFLIERTFGDNAEMPASFTIRGAGWGHGVGLCQIGAAVMGANGYDYRQILSHYFLDSDIKKVY